MPIRKTFAFIDASNIIYGTRDEDWKVDFKKLFEYLKERYECKKIYYFAGKDEKNEKQEKFYKKLELFGYDLILKKVKIYDQNGHKVRKANCDVDLTFYAMRDLNLFDRVVFLSGDGDFEILIQYFLKLTKEVIVMANGKRTAREIKQLVGENFTELKSIKKIIEFENKKRQTLRTNLPHVL